MANELLAAAARLLAIQRRFRIRVFGFFLVFLATGGPAFAQNYAVYGTTHVDLGTCKPLTPTSGSAAITFWVNRAPTVTGPTQLSFANVPPGVSVAVNPSTLTYPGWVIGQQVTATFTAPVDVDVADTIVTLNVADGTVQMPFQMLLYGSCPRSNKAFTIRGSFFSTHRGTMFPVEGAKVYIYRDVSWQIDPWVAIAKTRPDGSFEANIWDRDEGTYYAKLVLNDGEGVYLRDWYSSDEVTYESINRGSSAQPLIDLGATVITRDGGSGTAKPSIWQGGRAAFQEFISTVGRGPPTGAYEIVIQSTASGIVWTARSTTNWEDNQQTYKYSNGSPRPLSAILTSDDAYFFPFETYATNFHEFGHALRHTIDGDQRHFTDDASRWTYARGHSLCGGSDAGYIETEAYGFNEGWAEYWGLDDEDDIARCSIDLTDLTLEASVDYDLNLLARTLTNCLGLTGGHEKVVRAQRRNLFDVLNRGPNIIHSQGEFRSNFGQQFPSCSLPAVGTPLGTVALFAAQRFVPSSVDRYSRYYQARISRLREIIRAAQVSLREAQLATPPKWPCRKDCEVLIAAAVRPHKLAAELAFTRLVEKEMSWRFMREQRLAKRKASLPASGRDLDERARAFQVQRRKILSDFMVSSASTLERLAKLTRSSEAAAAAKQVRRAHRQLDLRGPSNGEFADILSIDWKTLDDVASPFTPDTARPR